MPTAEFSAIQLEEIVGKTMTLGEKSTEGKLKVRTLPAFRVVTLGQLIYLLLGQLIYLLLCCVWFFFISMVKVIVLINRINSP